MDLKSWLKRENNEWPPTVDSVRKAAKIIWERPLHRYYTDHSVSHSERIIEKLNDLTKGPKNSTHLISMTEMYILLAAAYLHDIGMQDERFRNGDLEQIRSQHHELTGELIRNNFFKRSDRTISLGLERVPPDIVDVIASWLKLTAEQSSLRANIQSLSMVEKLYGLVCWQLCCVLPMSWILTAGEYTWNSST